LLLEACKRAYRKHVMDDPDIAWSELCESLGATLAEVMGDKEFGKWADKISSEKTV